MTDSLVTDKQRNHFRSFTARTDLPCRSLRMRQRGGLGELRGWVGFGCSESMLSRAQSLSVQNESVEIAATLHNPYRIPLELQGVELMWVAA